MGSLSHGRNRMKCWDQSVTVLGGRDLLWDWTRRHRPHWALQTPVTLASSKDACNSTAKKLGGWNFTDVYFSESWRLGGKVKVSASLAPGRPLPGFQMIIFLLSSRGEGRTRRVLLSLPIGPHVCSNLITSKLHHPHRWGFSIWIWGGGAIFTAFVNYFTGSMIILELLKTSILKRSPK